MRRVKLTATLCVIALYSCLVRREKLKGTSMCDSEVFVFGETGEFDGNFVCIDCDSEIFVFGDTGEIDCNFVCDSAKFVYGETGRLMTN